MIDVSVIIPIFNAEDYLEDCLDSIVNQTFKNIEIICVNDGSTDDSLKILKKYQSEDNRIIIYNQENQGSSSARNVGLKNSKGKYIYFIDSDDYLEETALEKLVNISEEKNLDMVMFQLINVDDETKEIYTTPSYDMVKLDEIPHDEIFNYKQLGEDLFYLSVSVVGKFFKKSLIKDVRFSEGLIFEDNLFMLMIIFNAERIYFYRKHLYYRRRHLNSVTTSPDYHFMDTIDMSNKIFEYMKDNGLFDQYKRPLYNRKISSSYKRFHEINEGYKEEFFNRIKNDFMNHKDEFETDDDFLKVITPSSKFIFYSALSSQTYKEFENSFKLYKSKILIKELKKSNASLKKEIKHFKSSKTYKIWQIYAKIKNKIFH